eukprot:jgi/Undpi1/1637/HiC_scaffold_11.g05027.m1
MQHEPVASWRDRIKINEAASCLWRGGVVYWSPGGDGPPHEGNNRKQRTGRYNMHVLKEISRTEESALKELAVMFQVENDDSLPVSFDLPQLLDLKEGERRPFLYGMLQCCPSDMVPVFIDKYLDHINGLAPYVS